MKIITVEREFGSGGRELGKRLADALRVPCYDQEIIDEVAKLHGLDPAHVERVSETDVRTVYPMTIGRRFSVPQRMPARDRIRIFASQQEVIKALARQGDCVIVGYCADVILEELSPLNLFVYADKYSKLARCVQRGGENESQQSILRRMQKIDRDRAAYRELFTDTEWGKKDTYHLCVNTTGKEIKRLIPALAEYAKEWFTAGEK